MFDLIEKQQQTSELTQVLFSLKSTLLTVLIFSCFVNVLMLTGPLFMLQVYDRVLTSQSVETLVALFLIVIALYVCMACFDTLRNRIMTRVSFRFYHKLANIVFSNSIQAYTDPCLRDAPSNSIKDLKQLQSFIAGPVPMAIFDLPWLPFYLMIIYWFHPWLGIFGGLSALLTMLVAYIGQRLTRSMQLKTIQPSFNSSLLEQSAQHNAESIKALGMIKTFVSRWHAHQYDADLNNLSHRDTSGLFKSISKSFRLLLQSAILALGAYLVLINQLTAGVMIVSSILMGRALGPVDQLNGAFSEFQKSKFAFLSLLKMTNKPIKKSQSKCSSIDGDISAKNLLVGLKGSGNILVRGLNFVVPAGHSIGIIGPSGSGKSSLVKTLAGIWQPLAGELRIGGATYNQFDDDDLGRMFGYLPQIPQLFKGSIAENIARFDNNLDMQKVVKAAELAGIHRMILSLKDGYDTHIDFNGSGVSGGQSLRICLARALYDDPKLLILDEPNSFLDSEGEEALQAAIQKVKSMGTTVVIVAHSPSAIQHCEYTLIIVDGKQVKFGKTENFLKTSLFGDTQARAVNVKSDESARKRQD